MLPFRQAEDHGETSEHSDAHRGVPVFRADTSCHREARLGFGGVLAALPVVWVNHPNRATDAMFRQLTTAAACGLVVQPTLVTNVPGAAVRFCAEHGVANTVCKSVGPNTVIEGGHVEVVYTRRLTEAALEVSGGSAATPPSCRAGWTGPRGSGDREFEQFGPYAVPRPVTHHIVDIRTPVTVGLNPERFDSRTASPKRVNLLLQVCPTHRRALRQIALHLWAEHLNNRSPADEQSKPKNGPNSPVVSLSPNRRGHSFRRLTGGIELTESVPRETSARSSIGLTDSRPHFSPSDARGTK